MIAKHIDEEHGRAEEVKFFEKSFGPMANFILRMADSRCNKCGHLPALDDWVDYVITSSGSVIWWHHKKCKAGGSERKKFKKSKRS